jgi:hypothetical protein
MPQVNNPNSLAASHGGQMKELQAQLDDIKGANRNASYSLAVGVGGITDAGTLTVTGATTLTGAVTLMGGVTGPMAATGALTGASLTVTGDVASVNVNASGNFVAPNGTLVSTYARTHQVVTGYVSAWLDSATASSRRFKRDISPYRRDAWRRIKPVLYRLRSAWIVADIRGNTSDVPYEIGVLAEDMVKDFPELVVYDDKGKPWSFHYERLGVVAIDGLQQLDGEVQDLRAEVAELRALINRT